MLVTPYGMKFYWPHAVMSGNGRVNVRTEVFNFPIQGMATAEIIPIALVYFWHRTKHLRIAIFNTVHDSIISRVFREDVVEAQALAERALTRDVYDFMEIIYGYSLNVPLGVGTKIAKHWGDSAEEQVYELWRDGKERRTVK